MTTARNRTEPPVNRRLGFEAAPNKADLCFGAGYVLRGCAIESNYMYHFCGEFCQNLIWASNVKIANDNWAVPDKNWPPPIRAVASLTVPGGQSSTFLIFSSNFDQFFLFFLKLYLFSSSFWLSGWATRPPGKALATPLPPRECFFLSRKKNWNSKGRLESWLEFQIKFL